MTFYDALMTFYDQFCRLICHKMSEIVVTCQKVVLHSALRNVCESTQAIYQPFMRSCAHCVSPGEFGRLQSGLPKSAGPIRGAHSAWACHATRSRMHNIGPHSSELAVRFANEKGECLVGQGVVACG